MPVIGFLASQLPDAVTDRLRGFRQGLKDTGYVEGENVAIVYRFAENQDDRLPALAAELVTRHVAVIATAGLPPTLAAKAATTTVPIAFLVGDDPVRLADFSTGTGSAQTVLRGSPYGTARKGQKCRQTGITANSENKGWRCKFRD